MNMKLFIVFLMITLTLVVVGCASTTRSGWEPTAWHVQEQNRNVPEIGTLQDEQFNYDVIVTDLRKVVETYTYDPIQGSTFVTRHQRHPKTLIAVAVRCRNKSNGTLVLDTDPIQMIDASQTLTKKLTREEVIFKLYGGRMREASQLGMLEELNKPIRTSPTFFGAVLAGYIAAQRADARAFIIDEMYQKEYTAYDIFHHSFEPSSLPSGIASDWVQYYHYTFGPIKIILQGQKAGEGLTFTSPPNEIDRQLNDLLTSSEPTPEQTAAAKEKKRKSTMGMVISLSVIAGIVVLVIYSTITA